MEELKNHINVDGNSKVPSSIAIFNMGSATKCPSKKLGLCAACKSKVKCYALKSEQFYTNTIPYRNKQEKYWKKVKAENFIADFISMQQRKRNKFKGLRLNESGDFWSQKCVEKAEKIAKGLVKIGVKTYCYTSRSDLDYKGIKSLIISGSGFKKSGISSVFKIIDKKENRPKGYGLCAGDCSVCNRCMKRNMKTAVIKH